VPDGAPDPDGGATATPPDEGELRPLSSIRRVVARKMAEAWRTIPAVTLQRSAPFAALLAARDRLADPTGRKPAVDALLASLVGRALAEHELLNGSWREEERAVLVNPRRNVAVAVDTPGGLMAVVLQDADRRPVADLDADLVAMVERARAGRSRQPDLAGATFTITNLGGLGIDSFNPIVTPPQAAVLGVGAVRPSPIDDRPATLGLTFDHRVVDGADAARFLARLVELLRDPPF